MGLKSETLVTGVKVIAWPHDAELQGRCLIIEDAFPREQCMWIPNFSEWCAEAGAMNGADAGCGAIVIINGAAKPSPDIRVLNDQIRCFQWVMLFVIGDEGSGLHLEWIDHSKCSIWVFDAKPGKHDHFHHLPAGPLQQVRDQVSKLTGNKQYEWSWSGSVRDINWDAAIRALPHGGIYHAHHLSYEDYAQLLADSKVVPCRPSWTSPETCRVYDALEMGCIPIVGIYPGENPPGHYWWRDLGYDWSQYWKYIFGEVPPFPVIQNFQDLGWVVREELNTWTPAKALKIQKWWTDYKKRLVASLQAEVRRLQQ